MMSEITLPRAVEDFVAATNAHDGDGLLAVFAPGAVVVDDGTTYATETELREWIKVHQVDPKIVITPTSFDADRLVASVDGEFPGGPLSFAFTFATKGDAITHLSIEVA
jgi:ketosteroid isomerase-like protein